MLHADKYFLMEGTIQQRQATTELSQTTTTTTTTSTVSVSAKCSVADPGVGAGNPEPYIKTMAVVVRNKSF